MSVLKATGYDGVVVYAKVSPGASFEFNKTNEYAPGRPGEAGGYFDIFKIIYTDTQSYLGWQDENPDERKMRATLEWSPEINEHAVDVDLTQPGVVRYIAF